MTEGTELPNQDKIRTLKDKKTYKYLETLEADPIKQTDIKVKIKKRIPQKDKNTSGLVPGKIFRTILKVDEGRTSTNGSEKKKIHIDA